MGAVAISTPLITFRARDTLAWWVLCCITFLFAARPTYADETRIALVIGNSNYPTAQLKNPANDAKAIAGKLRALGFDVMLRTETTRRDMTRAISEFGAKLASGNMALFYYAGHGMQVKGKNFLIPVDAEIDNEEMVRTEGIDVDRLLERLKISRMNVVILDACRDNPFEKFRGGSGGLAEIDAPIGTFLAYATSPGKLAADGDGTNGVYTTELLKAIDVPGLKIEDVFKQVRINVLKASANRQVPWESSSMTAEFYFRPDAKSAAVDAQLRRAEQERLELQREMEKLRAELTRMIGAALSSSAGITPSQTAGATVTALATAPPPQIAAAPAASTVSPAPLATIEIWKKRIALLNNLGGKLDYAKAIAILLDIQDDKDLTELVRFERFLAGTGWANAHVMGVDAGGNPHWATAARFKNTSFAREAALENCLTEPSEPCENCETKKQNLCEIVYENGDFLESNFLHIADRMKNSNPVAARESYLLGISTPPRQEYSGGGQGFAGARPGNVGAARIYTPPTGTP